MLQNARVPAFTISELRVYQVEISSRLNSILFFKMISQLHVKISTRYTELKIQLGLANLRWNFKPGWKSQIFLIIDIFTNPRWKFDTTHPNSLFAFKKIKMVTSQVRFKWTDGKFIILIKCLQEFKNPMKFRNYDSNTIGKCEKKSIFSKKSREIYLF